MPYPCRYLGRPFQFRLLSPHLRKDHTRPKDHKVAHVLPSPPLDDTHQVLSLSLSVPLLIGALLGRRLAMCSAFGTPCS